MATTVIGLFINHLLRGQNFFYLCIDLKFFFVTSECLLSFIGVAFVFSGNALIECSMIVLHPWMYTCDHCGLFTCSKDMMHLSIYSLNLFSILISSVKDVILTIVLLL